MTDHTNPTPPTTAPDNSNNDESDNSFVAAWRGWYHEIVTTTAPTRRRLSEYGATLHPGHVCMITSIPLLLHSYYGYYNYSTHSEQLVQHLLTKQELLLLKQHQPPPVVVVSTSTAAAAVVPPPQVLLEESIRRSIGVAVASRALRIATTGMIGAFTFSVGILFYSTGTNSVAHMLATLQQSSRRHLQKWEDFIRPIFQSQNTNNNNHNKSQDSLQRYNENHPEYKKLQTMTEEEELEYIYQTYFESSEKEEEGNDDCDKSSP